MPNLMFLCVSAIVISSLHHGRFTLVPYRLQLFSLIRESSYCSRLLFSIAEIAHGWAGSVLTMGLSQLGNFSLEFQQISCWAVMPSHSYVEFDGVWIMIMATNIKLEV